MTLIHRQAAPGGRDRAPRGTAPKRSRRRVNALRGGVLAVLLLCLAGCSPNDTFTRFGFPNPVTEQGKITLSLWQGSWIAGLLVGAVVWGMILWSVIFHRKRGDKLPPQVRYNMPIEILYTVVPFVLNGTTPIGAFFYLATYGADLIIIAYLVTAVAALAWSIRRGKATVVRVAGLLAAIVVMAYIIKGTVYPIPAAPFDLCISAAGITIAIGIALLLIPRLRANLSRSTLFAAARAD